MSGIKTTSSCIFSLALLCALSGCVPVKPQPIRSNFLPPTPRPVQSPPVLEEQPPQIEAAVESREPAPQSPVLQAGISDRAAGVLREAQWHYQSGRKHYQEGEFDQARREFDRAVDVLLSSSESSPDLHRGLEAMVEAIHRLDLAGLGSGAVDEPAFEKAPLEDIPEMTFRVDPKLKDKVLEEVRATVSQLPLEVNDAVLSYIRYFSSERGRRTLVYGMRRAGRYHPLIRRILDEEGIPQELIFLAQAESGFIPRAVSRKKATGMWQFVSARGREYGLQRTLWYDDRLDPEKATRAAARHLRDLYGRYGDWYLAMAAYNGGPGMVDRAVERTGYADFWELKRRNVLPRETSNYVPIILAMTIMAKNADEYDLEDIDPDSPLEYDVLEIETPTHLQLVADLAECPVSQLRDLNPALLKDLAPAGWELRVPKQTGHTLSAVLGSIPPGKRSCWRVHRVADGDTLAAIARRYRVTEKSVLAANPDANGAIMETGALLVVPAAAEKAKPLPRRTVSKSRARPKVASRGGARVAALNARATSSVR